MTDPTAQPEDRRRAAEPLTRAIHAAVREKIAPRLDGAAAIWLHRATEPI